GASSSRDAHFCAIGTIACRFRTYNVARRRRVSTMALRPRHCDMPDSVALPLLFLAGLCIGSFLNVCNYRLPLNQSVVTPGSHCAVCDRSLQWYENFPVLSYVFL